MIITEKALETMMENFLKEIEEKRKNNTLHKWKLNAKIVEGIVFGLQRMERMRAVKIIRNHAVEMGIKNSSVLSEIERKILEG